MWNDNHWILITFCLTVFGCAAVSLKHMMPIETKRAQIQQQRAKDTVQLTESIAGSLPKDSPPQVTESLNIICEMAEVSQEDAVKSERFHVAGEKIMGPPPFEVDVGSDQEVAVLHQLEQDAETVGKARKVVHLGKRAVTAATSSSGWGGLMGNVMTLLTAAGGVGGVAALGRSQIKKQEEKRQREREVDRQERAREQERKDREQDELIDQLKSGLRDELATMRQDIRVTAEAIRTEFMASATKGPGCSISGEASSQG